MKTNIKLNEVVQIEINKTITKNLSKLKFDTTDNFYNNLFGSNIMRIHHMVHSIKTSLGQSFFQNIAYKFATLKYPTENVEREKLIDTSSTRADLVIGNKALQLKTSLNGLNKSMAIQQKSDFDIWSDNGYTPIFATMVDSNVNMFFMDILKPYNHFNAQKFWTFVGNDKTYSDILNVANNFNKNLITNEVFKDIRNDEKWRKYV